MSLTREQQIAALEKDWAENPRWKGIKRGYSAADVVRLRGSFQVEHTLARRGAEKLWDLVNNTPYVNCLGALTGGQAVQQAKAGIKAIYLSGWQVAADANSSKQTYPDQSLYPSNSAPDLVKRLNNALMRADQTHLSCRKYKYSKDLAYSLTRLLKGLMILFLFPRVYLSATG